MERISLKLVKAAVCGSLLLGSALFLGGCGASSNEAKATKEEESAFRNPKMTPPPEAGNIGGAPPANK